jgi:hypothetical protein
MRTYQHTAFKVLDKYDIIYEVTKATPVLVHGVGVDFYIFMDFASAQRLKQVGNRNARLPCVFGSTDGYGVRKNWVSFS